MGRRDRRHDAGRFSRHYLKEHAMSETTTTKKIYDPKHTNPEDWIGLVVTEYVNGTETDRYVTMRTAIS